MWSVWAYSFSLCACRTFASYYLSFCTSSSVATPNKWVCPEALWGLKMFWTWKEAASLESTCPRPPECQTLSLRLPLPHCSLDVWALIDVYILANMHSTVGNNTDMSCSTTYPHYIYTWCTNLHHIWILCNHGGMCMCLCSHTLTNTVI